MLSRAISYFFGKPDEVKTQLKQDVSSAVKNLRLSLVGTGESIQYVFHSLESSESKEAVKVGLKKVDNLMRSFLRLSIGRQGFPIVRAALLKLGVSKKFNLQLTKASTLEDAIHKYKIDVLHECSQQMRQIYNEDQRQEKLNNDLISRYFRNVDYVKANNGEVDVENLVIDNSFKTKHGELEEKLVNGKRGSKRKYTQNDSLPVKRSRLSTYHKNMKKAGLCYKFQFGKCKRGTSCKFKHIIYSQ